MTEALQLWKKLAGKTDAAAESQNASQGVVSCLSSFTSSGGWRLTSFSFGANSCFISIRCSCCICFRW